MNTVGYYMKWAVALGVTIGLQGCGKSPLKRDRQYQEVSEEDQSVGLDIEEEADLEAELPQDEDLENEELGEEGDSVVADQQEQEILTEQPTEEPNDEEFDGKGESLEEIEQDPLEEVKPVFDLADTGVGFRNFDQINATYSALTGVPTSNPAVAQGFIDLKSTLPFDNELATITPGQVSAYTKLAAFYCDEATSDVALRPAIYGSLDFNQPVATAFNNPQPLASSILDRFFRPGYSQTPEGAADIQMLVTLLDEIKVGKDNTANVAMGLCTAVLSSAGVTVY